MKNIINLIVLICLCSFGAQSQTGSSFGIRGGVNFQNINGTDDLEKDLANDLLTAFHAGIVATIPLVPTFYIQPGLLYTIKGAKFEDVVLNQTFSNTIKISYLEIPINFLFKPMLGSGHLLLGVGPYVALGIGGTSKYEGVGISRTNDIEFKNTVSVTDPIDGFYLKTIDMGANLLAGYEFGSGISFQLNAQLGLTEINPQDDRIISDKSSYKNTGFGISLGYNFYL